MLKWLAVVGVLVVVLPVVLLAMASWRSRQAPQLGVLDGNALTGCPQSPNCVSSQAVDDAHRVQPYRIDDELPAEAFQRLTRIVESMPGARLVDQSDRYARFEFTSRWFRFVDDLELLLVPEQHVIHVRSASRVGYSDLGANRQRVEAIRKKYEAAKHSTGASGQGAR